MKTINIYILLLILVINSKAIAQYSVLYNFNSTDLTCQPTGSLTLSNNVLYGLTVSGVGTTADDIFKINTDGTGYADIYDFKDTIGIDPLGLTISGNVLYGITAGNENADSIGFIYKINTDGTGYKVLFKFTGTDTIGSVPQSSLILFNDTLYGTTGWGGRYDYGTVFKINTDGTGYVDLHDFNFTNGANPYQNPLSLSGNKLYGMTYRGGANSMGCIYKINTDGMGYKDIHDFTENSPWPVGALTISNNVLYGSLWLGGSEGDGSFFKIDTDGTAYTTLYAFNGTNGQYCLGTPAFLYNTLFGMTYAGGLNQRGIIFSILPDGSDFSDLLDFNWMSVPLGSGPVGQLIMSDTVLYGMTLGGGGSDQGVIFKYVPVNTAIYESLSENYVYPNPTSGILHIDVQNLVKTEIFNMEGNHVGSYYGSVVDISSIPVGMYIMYIYNTDGLINREKIILSK